MTTNRCLGFWGWLLGHKHLVHHIDAYPTVYDHCLRCGRKAGG